MFFLFFNIKYIRFFHESIRGSLILAANNYKYIHYVHFFIYRPYQPIASDISDAEIENQRRSLSNLSTHSPRQADSRTRNFEDPPGDRSSDIDRIVGKFSHESFNFPTNRLI